MKRKIRLIALFLGIICIVTVGILCFFAFKQNDFRKNISKYIPGIVCWGDSLTVGVGGNGISYPKVLEDAIAENIGNIPVYNLGVGGESTKAIRARNGAIQIYLEKDVVIPADCTPVEVNLLLEDGTPLGILRQGNAGVETVTLAGKKGYLKIEQESYDSAYKYFFVREEEGKERKLYAGATLTPVGARRYNYCIPIIFMGQNGGWNTPEELIEQCEEMIAKQYKNKDRYLILGLTSGTEESRAELELAMENHFGNRYINLRKYLCEEGLTSAGVNATEEDLAEIAEGRVPGSLRYDKVHLNSYGYELIGKKVYERMLENGYFDYRIKVGK